MGATKEFLTDAIFFFSFFPVLNNIITINHSMSFFGNSFKFFYHFYFTNPNVYIIIY